MTTPIARSENRHEPPSRCAKLKTPTIAAALGIGCALSLGLRSTTFGSTLPEWVAQLIWLALVLGGSAACGYRTPERAWRWGAMLVGVQPPFILLWLLLVGEITDPSSSTGGLVAVVIFGVLALFVSPVAMLSSLIGARVRNRRATSEGE